MSLLFLCFIADGSTGKGDDVTTPTGSVGSAAEAIDELAGLTLEEQEKQRAEWSTVSFRVLLLLL